MAKGDKDNEFEKDPDDVLDYAINWAKFLDVMGDDDTVSNSVWTKEAGTVTLDQPQTTATKTAIRVTGGAVNERAALRNRITTAAGRIKDKTIYLKIKQH